MQTSKRARSIQHTHGILSTALPSTAVSSSASASHQFLRSHVRYVPLLAWPSAAASDQARRLILNNAHQNSPTGPTTAESPVMVCQAIATHWPSDYVLAANMHLRSHWMWLPCRGLRGLQRLFWYLDARLVATYKSPFRSFDDLLLLSSL